MLLGLYLVVFIPKTSNRQAYSSNQVQNHQDDKYQADDSEAATRTPSPISVITSSAAEQEQQDKNQNE